MIPMKHAPLVSVVTPVYNYDQHLAECIESVLAQTYKNWEFVIVSSRSMDRSGDIAEHYAQKDARIRVHHKTGFVPCRETSAQGGMRSLRTGPGRGSGPPGRARSPVR